MIKNKSFFLAVITNFLMLAAPFLSFFVTNYEEAVFNHWRFAYFSCISIFILFSFSIIAGLILSRINKKYLEPTLLTIGVVWFLLFLFTPIYYALIDIHTILISTMQSFGIEIIKGFAIGGYVIALSIIGISVFFLAKFDFFRFTVFIFAAAVALMPTLLLSIDLVLSSTNASKTIAPRLEVNPEGALTKENVYYIVVDAYNSQAGLRKFLNLDISDFIQLMKDNDFYHAEEAQSPYNMTFLTMSAIVNANYIVDEHSRPFKNESAFYPSIMRQKTPPAAVKAFKDLGYRYYVVGNQWADCNPRHSDCFDFNETSRIPYEIRTFMSATPFSWVEQKYGFGKIEPYPEFGVDAIGKVLRRLGTDALPRDPYFMLIHHLSPHSPYMFKSDCAVRKKVKFDFKAWSNKEKKLYIDNLLCTNKKIFQLIEKINSEDEDAIVIIVGDHGSAFHVKWDIPLAKWPQEQVQERSSVISLSRFPERCQKWLSPTINSVNLVRLAIACISGSKPRYLPNKTYIGTYGYAGPDGGRVHLVSQTP